MQIYNNDGKPNTRSVARCGYCRAAGHNATNCPRVAEDYAYFKKSPPVIPVGKSKTLKSCSWYATPRYWGEWYGNCLKAHKKQLRVQAKAAASPTGVTRSASKCGFCGSLNHNRRNCEAMDNYTADAIKANRNWRRTFYNIFVEQMGISEGALLNIKERAAWNESDHKEIIGIVTAVNWDELSLFCASGGNNGRHIYRDEAYRQDLIVTVQVGTDTQTITFEKGISDGARSLVKYSHSRWRAPHFVSVLSPSATPLGDEWIEEGHAKAMAFLTKKRSKAKLDEAKVTDLINQWL